MELSQIPPLVERLRLLHEENLRSKGSPPEPSSTVAERPIARPTNPAAQPSSSPPNPFIARALRALKQIAASRADDRGTGGDVRGSDDASHYGEIQKLLVDRDPIARRRQVLIERVLEQLESGQKVDRIDAPSPLQQELRLLVSPEGTAGGRFTVTNETREPVRVHFEAQPISTLAGPPVQPRSVTFEPAQPCLAIGEVCTIAIVVQLQSRRLDSALDLAVRVMADNRVLGRLWVELLPSPQLERED